MLMVANYVTRPADDPLLQPFLERLRRLDESKADLIYRAREGEAPLPAGASPGGGCEYLPQFRDDRSGQSVGPCGVAPPAR